MLIIDEDNLTKHEVPKDKECLLLQLYSEDDFDCDGDLVLDEDEYKIAVDAVFYFAIGKSLMKDEVAT